MLNLEMFNLTIDEKKELTEDDIKIRKILELCSKERITKYINDEMLKDISASHLLAAHKEVYVGHIKKKEIIKDMVNGEYLLENLSHIKGSDLDDEEIY